MKHNVHVFAVVRLKLVGIKAVSHKQAVRKAARRLWNTLYQTFSNANLRKLPAGVTDVEFGEELTHFLVDEEGDAEFARSTWHEDGGQPMPDPRTITVTMEGGLIADVEGIPSGYKVRVLDLDVEGMEEEDLVKLPDGKQAIENIWAAAAA